MTKTFLTIGHKHDGEFDSSPTRSVLLWEFEKLARSHELEDAKQIQLTFNDYEIDQYPDQEAAIAYVKKAYTNKNGELYWCGDKYDTFEQLLAEVKDQKYLAELVVNY